VEPHRADSKRRDGRSRYRLVANVPDYGWPNEALTGSPLPFALARFM
jgi:hypothetical protein